MYWPSKTNYLLHPEVVRVYAEDPSPSKVPIISISLLQHAQKIAAYICTLKYANTWL